MKSYNAVLLFFLLSAGISPVPNALASFDGTPQQEDTLPGDEYERTRGQEAWDPF